MKQGSYTIDGFTFTRTGETAYFCPVGLWVERDGGKWGVVVTQGVVTMPNTIDTPEKAEAYSRAFGAAAELAVMLNGEDA